MRNYFCRAVHILTEQAAELHSLLQVKLQGQLNMNLLRHSRTGRCASNGTPVPSSHLYLQHAPNLLHMEDLRAATCTALNNFSEDIN